MGLLLFLKLFKKYQTINKQLFLIKGKISLLRVFHHYESIIFIDKMKTDSIDKNEKSFS